MKEEDVEELMIRTSIEANLTREELIRTWQKSGLIGVYNLGMMNMAEYILKDEEENERNFRE